MRVKNGDQHKQAIIAAATHLFSGRSVKDVSIDDIVKTAGIAKGTFYLYFTSKKALLSHLAEDWVGKMVSKVNEIAARTDMSAFQLFIVAFFSLKEIENDQPYLHAALDTANNIDLHEQINIAWVKQIGVALAPLIERGCCEGDFDVEDALSTIQFILAGQAYLLGNKQFSWSEAECQAHFIAVLKLAERALGVKQGRLLEAFLGNDLYQKKD
ncbi:TetR/AcrR family transcriptional regulator [Bartonella sp. HY329]|uniref:TetR/AcrR family transcriptional regulator n=1 Tax=unclassified Bartonella TaxID=2645622 RepID=UPI0021C6579D|nr:MULTISPECIES: TetR/AcrR family transcriptional regulator [unclassified Bartonella]UXM95174.1 TetR/AcrR family transcriptional regulator [Bartonella sp. HY329]UXN09497.1 TetR/AcrR family transcriptional regulator [Bartonella sp. HY328]